tara:strand:+ start:101 stop:604 length:504 start_codon:yes stop_codon:yes gene_type:complete
MNNDTIKENNTSNNAKDKPCKEYNSLKYKTMIMTGNALDSTILNETNETDLNNFLTNETQKNKNQNWSKLSKTERIKKLNIYVKDVLTSQYNLNNEEVNNLKQFIYHLLERKKITKKNEISYDENTGVIQNIHVLLFNSKIRKFTLNKNINEVKKYKRKTTKLHKQV